MSQQQIIISGGGLNGGLMGIALAQNGIPSTIVDKLTYDITLDQEFDGRTTSISAGSKEFLETVDVWAELSAQAQPILDIYVSDAVSPGHLHFSSDAGDKLPMGYMVENRFLRRAIYNRMKQFSEITLIQGVSVEDTHIKGEARTLILSDGNTISASLVIAAEGKNSLLRDICNIKTLSRDYQQTAMVGVVSHEFDHHGYAFEHFRPNGPLALLPMTGKRSAFVWTELPEKAKILMTESDEAFTQSLHDHFADTLGAFTLQGKRWAYPLSVTLSLTQTAERLVIIGDAAHAMHPVAGQGLNVGIRDVQTLARHLAEAHDLGLDIGTSFILKKYARSRKIDHVSMVAMTHGLVRLFSTDIFPLAYVRTKGLSLVNKMSALKKPLMKRAMGVSIV